MLRPEHESKWYSWDEEDRVLRLPTYHAEPKDAHYYATHGVLLMAGLRLDGVFTPDYVPRFKESEYTTAVRLIEVAEAAEELPAGSSDRAWESLADGTFDDTMWARYVPRQEAE